MYSYEIVDEEHIYGYVAHINMMIAAIVALIGLNMHNSEQYSSALFETDYEKIGDLYADDEE